MTFAKIVALAALPVCLALAGPAAAYDNDDQELRVRDMIADPSVPLAWDRRAHPETWRYHHRHGGHYAVRCGKRAYWDGEECVLKRRWR